MLTILASYAQEESLSNSENVKWALKKNAEEGKWRRFWRIYGYVWNDGGGGDGGNNNNNSGGGAFEINAEQAEIVRFIFSEYLRGTSSPVIARELNERGIQSYSGVKWSDKAVMHIIHNEKYSGDVTLNKIYVTDYLTKKVRKNDGGHAKYHIKDAFPPIIDRETWNAAQEVCKRKNRNDPAFEGISYPFTAKIWCAHCNKTFRSIQRTGGQRYWSCFIHRYRGADNCPNMPIPEYALFEQTAAVLGFDEWTGDDGLTEADGSTKSTETAFRERVERIIVSENNKLRYIFYNSTETTREWRHKTAAEYKLWKAARK